MPPVNRFYVALLFACFFISYTPITQAEMQQQNYDNALPDNASYGTKIGNKALIAFANITTSPLELPKNIINTMNQSNFFYGVFGGFLKGLVNTLGRTGCGIADLLTFPLPTKPVAHPLYIWDDFDVDTTYGDVYRLNKSQKIEQPPTEKPVTQVIPTPAVVGPKTVVVDRSAQYNQQTNKSLDTVFKNEMQK
jgi:putative exosortase-associated protein (TIGR04073 family)